MPVPKARTNIHCIGKSTIFQTAINKIDTQVTQIEYYTPMTQHGCNSSYDQDGNRCDGGGCDNTRFLDPLLGSYVTSSVRPSVSL